MSEGFDPYHRWLGISPKHRPPNHYRLLGLELGESDPEVIRDAAERQMGHVRQYQLGPHAELSQQILNELAAAKSCLLDPEKKAAYDARLQTEWPPLPPAPVPPAETLRQPPPLFTQEAGGPSPAARSALLLWGSLAATAAAVVTLVVVLVVFGLRPAAEVAVTQPDPSPVPTVVPEPVAQPPIVAPLPPETPAPPIAPPSAAPPAVETDWTAIGAQIGRAVVRVQMVATGGRSRDGHGLLVGGEPLLVTSAALAEQVEAGTAFLADGSAQAVVLPGVIDTRLGLAAFRLPTSSIEVISRLSPPAAGTPLATFHISSPTNIEPSVWNAVGTVAREEAMRRLGRNAEHTAAPSVAAQFGLAPAVWLALEGPAKMDDLGAPLFNAQAQLVGLLVWSDPDRKAHFAASALQLAEFHRHAAATMVAPATLPVVAKPVGPVFPSGTQFSTRFCDTAADPVQLALGAAQSTGQVIDVGKVGDFLKGFVRPGNDGAAAAFFDRKATQPALAIAYRNEQRHGVVQTWNESGQRTYCCQYQNGQREGLCCLWENGQPRVALEYHNGQCQGLLLLNGEKTVGSFADRKSADADSVAGPKLAQLRQIEEAVDRVENLLMRRFQAELEERQEQEQRQRTAAYTRQARERINKRIEEGQRKSAENLRALQKRVSGH